MLVSVKKVNKFRISTRIYFKNLSPKISKSSMTLTVKGFALVGVNYDRFLDNILFIDGLCIETKPPSKNLFFAGKKMVSKTL